MTSPKMAITIRKMREILFPLSDICNCDGARGCLAWCVSKTVQRALSLSPTEVDGALDEVRAEVLDGVIAWCEDRASPIYAGTDAEGTAAFNAGLEHIKTLATVKAAHIRAKREEIINE